MNSAVTSIAFRMKLKPGAQAEYRRRHDAIWPELLDALRAAGIYDYSIFLDPETLSLFAVLKLKADHRRETLGEDALMHRWWEYMADLMETSGQAIAGESTADRPREWPLELMFHMD